MTTKTTEAARHLLRINVALVRAIQNSYSYSNLPLGLVAAESSH